MSILDYPISAPYHYELETPALYTITIDGHVLYNDGSYAIVQVDKSSPEFLYFVFSFDEVCKISPKFNSIFSESKDVLRKKEYVLVDVDDTAPICRTQFFEEEE